jgi:hypothetical protein
MYRHVIKKASMFDTLCAMHVKFFAPEVLDGLSYFKNVSAMGLNSQGRWPFASC